MISKTGCNGGSSRLFFGAIRRSTLWRSISRGTRLTRRPLSNLARAPHAPQTIPLRSLGSAVAFPAARTHRKPSGICCTTASMRLVKSRVTAGTWTSFTMLTRTRPARCTPGMVASFAMWTCSMRPFFASRRARRWMSIRNNACCCRSRGSHWKTPVFRPPH